MATSRKQKVAAMTKAGLTPREISGALGITTQRVYQILEELGIKPARRPKEATA